MLQFGDKGRDGSKYCQPIVRSAPPAVRDCGALSRAASQRATSKPPSEKQFPPANRPRDAFAGAPVRVVKDERDLAEVIRLELQASGHPAQLSETVGPRSF
jgi:hypothetical protein